MNDQERGSEPDAGTREPGEDAGEEPRNAGGDEGGGAGKRGFSEGIKQGLGVLSAFKEALEETIHDARERGDLSAERAREVVQGAMSRAREAAGEAKERLDFATQQDLDALVERVQELRVRLENLERRVPQDPSAGPSRPSGEDAEGG